MTPEDVKRFNAHVKGRLSACPMCGNPDWALRAVIAPHPFVMPQKEMLTQQAWTWKAVSPVVDSVPLALAGCTKCHYVISYFWNLIPPGVPDGG